MIRVISSTSGAAARSYFSSGLVRADYYTDDIIGKWHGKAAAMLGLSGEVKEEEFARLCENLHPITEEKLNPRVNSKRVIGWDINFHAPKSLSLLYAHTGDARILEIFRQSVAETMADIEAQTQTRIRRDGASADRETGNLVWAEFVHLTARPVGGIPDPHLHIHAYTFNSTYDAVEERWKAAKMKESRRDMPLHQAAFHARTAHGIKQLGYEIKRTRSGWEIGHIPRSAIDKNSRRTAQIEREADRRGIRDDKEKDKLGALTREGKNRGLTQQELIQAWEARLLPEELAAIKSAGAKHNQAIELPSASLAIDHAIEKLFARDSVVRKNRVLAEALRFGVGRVSPEEIRAEYASRKFWEKNYNGEILCTHSQVLAEEVALVSYVREGKGQFSPLVPGKLHIKRDFLSKEQQDAVQHIVQSNDRVIAMRGGAGTGKTTAMKEVVEQIEASGKKVFALAPSADASRGTLRESGFANAETVAHFLTNKDLQKQSRGQVVWVDEAGLLGTRDLWALVEATDSNTRIILTGDTNQHSPVARGDAFRVLQQFAGLKPVEITEIRRQKPEIYRSAVSDLSNNNLKNAFLKLDSMGAIREIPDTEERYQKLASDYAQLSKGKTVPLVVSPTRKESGTVTKAIRDQLKQNGKLKQEQKFVQYRNLHLETAQRQEAENYHPGMMIQYHQNAQGVKRGERLFVTDITDSGKIHLRNQAGNEQELQFDSATKFQVFSSDTIELAKGDRIRITRNGFSRDGRRHSNGNVREIAGFTKDGHIQLRTGAVIDKEDGHFQYGYCQTSYSSQSKSVKDVLIAQSSDSIGAASREQFYVVVSRGKERVIIYTDDRIALQEMVGISNANRSALELAKESGRGWSEAFEKELNRKQWQQSVAKKGSKETARKFVDQIFSKRSETNKEKHWENYVSDRRGYSQFRSPNAPDHRHHSATINKAQSHPNSKLQNQKTTSPRIKRLTDTLARTQEWLKPTTILRQSRSKIETLTAQYRRLRLRRTPEAKKLQSKPSLQRTKPVTISASSIKR